MLEIAIFAVAASALSAAGRHVLAGVLAAMYVANRVLIAAWKQ